MSISLVPEDSRHRRYLCVGGETLFPVPFPFFSAAHLEVYRSNGAGLALLVAGSDYTVSGAGEAAGGTVTLTAAAAAGDLVIVVSAQPAARTVQWTDGQALTAAALNAEFARWWIAHQQEKGVLQRALRAPSTDPPDGMVLPPVPDRTNRLVGFDSVGAMVLYPTGSAGSLSEVIALGGSTLRTLAERFAERVNVRDHGAAGNGATDDTAALNAAAAYAASTGRMLWFPAGDYRTTGPVTVGGGARGVVMDGEIVAAGGHAALTLGSGGVTDNRGKLYGPIRVRRATQSNWASEADIGVVAQNCNASIIEIARAEGFTIGVRTQGDGRGFEDSTVILGRIVDNRIGLDVRTLQAGAWNNSVRYISGHFACASATHPTLARFGVRLSAAPGAYELHNAHVFIGPAFELQRQGTPGTVDAIPFLLEVPGRALHAIGVRMEGCSPFVARHTAGFNDAVYEVNFTGTYGFNGAAVEYIGATVAGGVSIARHQAAAAHGSPRLIAAVPNVRAAAFRNLVSEPNGVGFEQLAVLSGNPAGPPTTLNGFCFGGLDSIPLNAGDVTLPTSRALAFVVDCARSKEFVLAVEGSELRPIVMQFDAAENVLGSAAAVLLSNMNVTWVGSAANWWEGVSNLDQLTGGFALHRHQRVTLHANAAFAVIGVRGGSASARVNALRLYAGALDAPLVLAGGNRAWGSREISTALSWTVPALSPGATATQDVTLSGLRGGDFVEAGFHKTSGFQNGGVVFHAVQGGTGSVNQARVTAQNISGGTIDVGAGTLFVRAVRPRL